jgi:hypothetical protein
VSREHVSAAQVGGYLVSIAGFLLYSLAVSQRAAEAAAAKREREKAA